MTNNITVLKFENNPLFKSDTNCCNTLPKFYATEREEVLKLNYYAPEEGIIDMNNKNIQYNHKDVYGTDMIAIYRSIAKLKKEIPSLRKILSKSNKEENTENILYQRFEHLDIENTLKEEIKNYEEKIINIKNERDEINNKLLNLENNINDLEMNKNILNNLSRYTLIEKEQNELIEEIQKRKENMRINKRKKKLNLYENEENEENNIENNNTKASILLEQFNINDENKLNIYLLRAQNSRKLKNQELEDKLNKLNIDKKIYLEKLNILNNEISKLISLKNKKIDNLYIHYLNILKEGTDTRSEGLSWIIREIFALNKNVLMSFLPNFLDEDAIKFLFKQVKISNKIKTIEKEISKKLDELNKFGVRNYAKKLTTKQTRLTEKYSVIKNEKYNINNYSNFKKNHEQKNCLTERKISDLINIPPILKLKDVKNLIKNSENNLSKNQQKLLKDYLNLLNIKKNIKLEYEDLKEKEMMRIFDEFLKNNYYERFKVEKNVVLSALIGEDNILPELNKQVREARKYFDSMKKIKMQNNVNNSMSLVSVNNTKKNIDNINKMLGHEYLKTD